ncbi:MAG: hypothetical protein RBU29_05750 [bacterium]|jgi:hypothetical protein|nr:hypothetical protein [bacterium]
MKHAILFLFAGTIVLSAQGSFFAVADETPEVAAPLSPRAAYRQHYKDFYQSSDFATRYREAYDPANYRDWYRTLYDSSRSRHLDFYDSPLYHLDSSKSIGIVDPYDYGPRRLKVPPAGPEPEPLLVPAPVAAPSASPLPVQKEFILWQDSFFLYDKYIQLYNANRSAPEKQAKTQPKSSLPLATSATLRSPQELLYVEGMKAFSQRKYDDAHKCFKTLAEIKPSIPANLAALGLSFFALGNYTKAAEYLLMEGISMDLVDLDQFYGNESDYALHRGRLEQFTRTNPETKRAKELLAFFELMDE